MKPAMNQSKMTLILNTITVVLSLFIIGSFAMLLNFSGKVQQAMTSRYDLTSNANIFIDGSTTLTDEVRAYAATADERHYNNYWNEVNVDKNRDTGLANMQKIGLTTEEQSLIDEMSNLSNTLVPFEEAAMDMVRAGQKSEAIEAVYGEFYQSTVTQIHQIQKDFLNELDARTSSEVKSLLAVQSGIGVFVFFSVIVVIISQVVSFFMIRKKVIAPIIAVQKEMEEIARGNLSSDFDMEPDTSEIGRLIGAILHTRSEMKKYISHISHTLSQIAKGRLDLKVDIEYAGDFHPIQVSLDTILNSLNSMLRQIDMVAEQLTGNADQVAGSSQGLAQGATEQASAVEELSATLNDLSEHMGSIAENAEKAHEFTSQDSKVLDLSAQQMKEMLQAMDDISNASNEISKIIKSIEDIAFQTNILALNAAVEAARAGAAGKGFAVVADEVRNLANKSQEASGNTGLLTQNTAQAVKRGVGLTETTAKTLNTVVLDSQQSATYVKEIATSLAHQSEALQQVNLGIEQISSVVQTNSATAEQSAAAAGELSTQAKQLKSLVGQFHLR